MKHMSIQNFQYLFQSFYKENSIDGQPIFQPELSLICKLHSQRRVERNKEASECKRRKGIPWYGRFGKAERALVGRYRGKVMADR